MGGSRGGGGGAKGDAAPLYVFDYRVLQEPEYFDEDTRNGSARPRRLRQGCLFSDTGQPVVREFQVPKCFSRDVMGNLTGMCVRVRVLGLRV